MAASGTLKYVKIVKKRFEANNKDTISLPKICSINPLMPGVYKNGHT